MKGLLAGKIRRGHEFDPADKRLQYEIFQGEQFERAQRLLDRLDDLAAELGKTVLQVVVNWTYHQSGILSVLCGCLLYTSPSPRDATLSRMPSSA